MEEYQLIIGESMEIVEFHFGHIMAELVKRNALQLTAQEIETLGTRNLLFYVRNDHCSWSVFSAVLQQKTPPRNAHMHSHTLINLLHRLPLCLRKKGERLLN
jgi:hypothetical protein